MDNVAVLAGAPNLDNAKLELAKHTTGSRLIAEVRNGKVEADPHQVDGQNQSPENGFNKYWSGWADIHRMIAVARSYGMWQ